MMKKHFIYNACLAAAILTAGASELHAENILKILEGYGRDSIATFSTQNGQAEAARLFNLLLEPDGKVVTEKAEQYLSTAGSSLIRSYLCVMLADYTFVNNGFDSGLRYLKRAVDEHDPIRNDSYYRLVLGRAQMLIEESPGKTAEHKTTVLSEYNPAVVKKTPEPAAPVLKPDSSAEAAPEKPEIQIPEPVAAAQPAFRIQTGAYSLAENAERKKVFFEGAGYPVEIEIREGSSGSLYLVRIGAYETYDEAKNALTRLKKNHPSEEGIVIKVEKK